MKRLIVLLLGALALCLPAAPAAAQTMSAKTVTACGTPGNTPVVGNPYPITQDTTGTLCTTGISGTVLIGTTQSGATAAVIGCDKHAFYDGSTALKTLVAGVSAKKIYVCGWIDATDGTATSLQLTSGTGSDCVSTSVAIQPLYNLVANDRIGSISPFWNGLVTLANADNLCGFASAANAHSFEVWYTVQ